MPEQLIATAGVWFFAACAADFVAMFVEHAGAPRSPEEDAERKRAALLALMLASLATTALLILQGFFLTTTAETLLRAAIVAAPIAAMLLGSLLGAVAGAVVRSAAPTMRTLALPLVLVAFALTLYAASPSIVALANSIQHGELELPVHPV
jgi:hypothetical protein